MRLRGWFLTILGAVTTMGALAQTYTLDEDMVSTNGEVFALDQVGDTLYVGGLFDHLGDYVGGGASFDSQTGQINAESPDFGFTVSASTPDGNGGFYFSSSFLGLRHLLPDGTIDPNWTPSVGGVTALVTSGEWVYVGGGFDTAGGERRLHLAAFHVDTGQLSTWNNGVWMNGQTNGGFPRVGALAIDGTTLYIGGKFTAAGGPVSGFLRANIASFDVRFTNALSWNPSIGAGNTDEGVKAIVVAGPDVYVGGEFPIVGAVGVNNLARISRTTAQASQVWNPSTDATVHALDLTNDSLFIGGEFTLVSGEARARVAEVDLINGAPTAWNPGANETVTAIDVDGDTVRLGGKFTELAGQPRSMLGAVNAATGVATSWNPQLDKEVLTISHSNTDVLVGGYFSLMNAVARSCAASINLTTGQVTDWDPNPIYIVRAIAATDARVFVGGEFSVFDGDDSIQYLAGVNATDGALLPGWSATPDGVVYALDHNGTTLYVGGRFNEVDGLTRQGLAALDDTTGAVLAWDPDASDDQGGHSHNAQIYALKANGSTVHVGGSFRNIGGMDRYQLAEVDATTAIATAFAPSLEGEVHSLSVTGSRVYAGGSFRQPSVGGGETSLTGIALTWKNLAAFDSTNGDRIGWTPEPNQQVQAVVATDATVFAGGWYNQLDGVNQLGLAAINTVTATAEAWQPGLNTVEALHRDGSTLYVGGRFNKSNGGPRNYLARYDNVLPPLIVVPVEEIADFLLGLGGLTPQEQAAADVNFDSKLDVADVVTTVNQE